MPNTAMKYARRLFQGFILTFTKGLQRRRRIFLLDNLDFTTILHHLFGRCYLLSNHCALFAVTFSFRILIQNLRITDSEYKDLDEKT